MENIGKKAIKEKNRNFLVFGPSRHSIGKKFDVENHIKSNINKPLPIYNYEKKNNSDYFMLYWALFSIITGITITYLIF